MFRFFKPVGAQVMSSFGIVKINLTLQTTDRKWTLHHITTFFVPIEEDDVRYEATCVGGLALGNPFLVHSGLNVVDFMATIRGTIVFIDYDQLDSQVSPEKLYKPSVIFLTNDVEIELEQLSEKTLPRFPNIALSWNFAAHDGDGIK